MVKKANSLKKLNEMSRERNGCDQIRKGIWIKREIGNNVQIEG